MAASPRAHSADNMPESNSQLDIVYRMMSAFASSSDMAQTLYEGLDYIRAEIGAEAASFFVLQEDGNKLRCEACIGPADITGLEIPADQGIVGAVTQSDEMRYVRDTVDDPDFTGAVDAKTGFETKSMICVPVSGHGKRFGALQLINRSDGALFSDDDAALVSVYGKSAALALANSQMATRMIEADNFQRDLRMASRVQESLFPSADFDFIHGVNVPKKGVSGDLYDYVERDGKFYFCMADVSGKGTDAALVMAKTHSLFRTISRNNPAVNDLAARVNAELVETAFNGMFVTAIIGCYEPESGAMQCCNAGHEPGLIVDTTGRFSYVEASLQPLGILDFEAADISVEHHDLSSARLFCYSDGITEAEINGTMLGAAKLAAILSEQMGFAIADQIIHTVDVVRQKADRLSDDLTLLGLGCAPRKQIASGLQAGIVEPALSGEQFLFNISITNEVPELRRLRREIEKQLGATQAHGIAVNVCLAVDEATQNIIRHAFPENMSGRIEVGGYIAAQKLHVSITDTAPLIDLDRVKPRDLEDIREGGLGTHLIQEITEKARWWHDGDRNRLDLTFAL
ncbi:MAG: SpoIIE family protein phosphatase [Alphaproteobacteria bacterium]|nr:SpoIIE family protein phosphatase [Alphaproteobacteria bacterium]